MLRPRSPKLTRTQPCSDLMGEILIRLALIGIALAGWFWTHSTCWAEAGSPPASGTRSRMDVAAACMAPRASAGDQRDAHRQFRRDRLIGLTDRRGDLRPSFRPFIALFVLFVLRQMCQSLCALPTRRARSGATRDFRRCWSPMAPTTTFILRAYRDRGARRDRARTRRPAMARACHVRHRRARSRNGAGVARALHDDVFAAALAAFFAYISAQPRAGQRRVDQSVFETSGKGNKHAKNGPEAVTLPRRCAATG